MNMIYRQGQIVGYVNVDRASVLIEAARSCRWFVLKTFPDRESRVMRTFGQRGISAYFPTERVEVRRESRRFGRLVRRIKATVTKPVFPGVILIPEFQARLGGVMVDGVEGYFRMGDCYPYLKAEQFDRLREFVGFRNIPVGDKRRLLAQGQRVYINDGPFAQFMGTFDSLDSEGRLKILVDLFGRQTPVTLDEDQIEPA